MPFLFLSAFLGGAIAYYLGSPMPFLIGGVIGAGIFVVAYEYAGHTLKKINPMVRLVAVASIGAMIGSRVSTDLLFILPQFWISALALLPFILLGHSGCYWLLRKVGKYRRVDAYFAGMPGGLVEALLLGEKAGADIRILTVQHFIRVLGIVVCIPFLFYLTTGVVVGSAGGGGAEAVSYDYSDILLIFVIAAIGLTIARRLKMPASHLLGPLLLSVALSMTGVADISVPPWLLHLAQLIVGATLGAQFSGISSQVLRRGLGLGVLSVTYLLCLGYVFALLLEPYVPADVSAVFISFAAGGLAEMSLVALSLDLSPVVVALHHLFRIFMTIFLGNKIYQRYFKD